MVKTMFNSGKAYAAETVEFSPEGHVIVVPEGNAAVKRSAELLAAYFKGIGFELPVIEDTAEPQEKEILVGETNRIQRPRPLREGILLSELTEDGKLNISGGHEVTVESAVKRFIRINKNPEEITLFSELTDFQSKKPGGYKYVWGDEFEDSEFDLTKWCFKARMGGTGEIKVSCDRDALKIYDGHATLRAMHWRDPEDENKKYKVPLSLCTHDTMNFDYGYAEIRANVPFINGVWPSFWATTSCTVRGFRNMQWHAEIDCFEVFGSPTTFVSNIHKWYDEFDYRTVYNSTSRHNQYPGAKRPRVTFDNPDTINNEWHTYGFEKTETEINFFLDGNYYGSCDIVNTWDAHEDMSVFQDPVFLIMNNHVFADDSKFKPSVISDNPGKLPADYHIDWVRLYMKPDKGTLYIGENPATYPEREE